MKSCMWILAIFFSSAFLFYAGVNCNNNETDLGLVCPNGKEKCSNNDTCCPSGLTYKCCPLLHAVCCNDGDHCCPADTICDLKQKRCIGINFIQVNSIIPTAFKSLKKQISATVNGICPDYVHFCDEWLTCCRTQTGDYRCCPIELGICCADGLRCCYYGWTCINNTCIYYDKNILVSPMKTFSAKRLNDITCNDGHHCPDTDTCCQLSTGNWGCCPLKNAVCCPDKIHCCPEGTICDPYEDTCL